MTAPAERKIIPKAHVDNLYGRISKMEKELDKHRGGFVACMTGKQFTRHSLEQQAKGIDSLLSTIVKANGEHLKADNIANLIIHAKGMAKKLKDQATTELAAEEIEKDAEPLALYDFIDSYEGLPMMQLWDWLMYNGYTKRVKE